MLGLCSRRGILLCVLLLSAVCLLPGLGSSSRFTYHEAFVAQGAREIVASGNWAHPTIGGLPWLEKPPLPWWFVAGLSCCTGGVSETVARLPSALAAMALCMGTAILAARHYGLRIGLLSGAVQATTAWTVVRGRLAEADVLLACLIVWTIVAFDSVLYAPPGEVKKGPGVSFRRGLPRWAFFILLGMMSLVKGIGFGAVLTLTVAAAFLAWQRVGASVWRLWLPRGWVLAAAITLAWPLLMIAQHGSAAINLWTMHVAERVTGQAGPGPFASESGWEYTLGLLGQALPWTPFAFVGAWGSLSRAVWRQGRAESRRLQGRIPAAVLAGDRLLWMWAIIPLGLLALAAVKNAHYAVSAQVPWSIWSALGLVQLQERLELRGWDSRLLHLALRAVFVTVAVMYGLGYWLIGPWLDRRGLEWVFYESAGKRLSANVPLALLYDDWDRNPYESSFGPIPHDLAVRLFYLGRPACWHIGPDSLLTCDQRCANASFGDVHRWAGDSSLCSRTSGFCVIGRDRDLPVLEQLGSVEVLARGPKVRVDRTYSLFWVSRIPRAATPPQDLASSHVAPDQRRKAGCEYGTTDLW